MSANAQVTVIIPCFNQGRFLAECVGSVHAQTYTDWHAIIVNDCSTDDETAALCDAEAGPKVSVVHLAENAGLPGARNAAIARVQTPFIVPLDSDDALEPESLATTVPIVQADPGLGFAYTDYRRFDGREGVLRAHPFDVAALYRHQIIWAGGACCRKQIFDDVGGYCTDFRACNEDYDFWLAVVGAGWRGQHVPLPLYRYRCHAGSWTSTAQKQNDGEYRTRLRMLERHRAEFERHGAADRFLADSHRVEARRLASSGEAAAARKLWREVAALEPWNLAARWRAR